jgi:DNA-binding NarL/FixJ family response regulator
MHLPVRLIIADDHALFIEGLALLFKDEQDFEVVTIANDGKELLRLLPQYPADVVLLDINMPRLNGLETARFIKQAHPALKIILLSTYNEEHLVQKAKTLDVHGYLLKTTNKAELLHTIRSVAGGATCFPNRLHTPTNEFEVHDSFLKQHSITKRESEILYLIKEGHTNQQIAQHLSLSIYTIETHRKNIMQKLGLKSTAALYKFLHEQPDNR